MEKITDPDYIYKNWRRAAVLTPLMSVGNTNRNVKNISELYKQATLNDVLIAVTPELALTSYSLADAFGFAHIWNDVQTGLATLAESTKKHNTVLVVGTPIEHRDNLYNCAVVISKGEIRGVVPKQHLANYSEFYEKRWFNSGAGITDSAISINNETVPFGVDLLFSAGDVVFGAEICEDLWIADPPSRKLTQAGAHIVVNLSSSTEIVGKSAVRRALVSQTADRLMCGYVYASSDASESTADVIMSGHALISEFDWILAERKPLSLDERVLIADFDIAHIKQERRKNQSWQSDNTSTYRIIDTATQQVQPAIPIRTVDPHPFTPSDETERQEVANHILNLQAHGLKKRLSHIGSSGKYPKIVLGLSGGLDSTLALLAAARACDLLRIPRTTIHTITMPATASSARTQDNATLLAKAIGTTHEVIAIQKLVDDQLDALGHNRKTQDITYENTQARTRTELLFNRANQVEGIVLGTGDLSELALGWCTYNGDHMSNYAVNAGIPKTLVYYIVKAASLNEEFVSAKEVLYDILETPVSPELTGNGVLSQETESLIGPYELHDFFIYHLLRWGAGRREILSLAILAFTDIYKPREIDKWLDVFCKRFISQQFKRNCMPDGVKVGRVALSPRGDLRFPSDADLTLLLES